MACCWWREEHARKARKARATRAMAWRSTGSCHRSRGGRVPTRERRTLLWEYASSSRNCTPPLDIPLAATLAATLRGEVEANFPSSLAHSRLPPPLALTVCSLPAMPSRGAARGVPAFPLRRRATTSARCVCGRLVQSRRSCSLRLTQRCSCARGRQTWKSAGAPPHHPPA